MCVRVIRNLQVVYAGADQHVPFLAKSTIWHFGSIACRINELLAENKGATHLSLLVYSSVALRLIYLNRKSLILLE
jgi:hypothetical protein